MFDPVKFTEDYYRDPVRAMRASRFDNALKGMLYDRENGLQMAMIILQTRCAAMEAAEIKYQIND